VVRIQIRSDVDLFGQIRILTFGNGSGSGYEANKIDILFASVADLVGPGPFFRSGSGRLGTDLDSIPDLVPDPGLI
jgi:hypothetical protein